MRHLRWSADQPGDQITGVDQSFQRKYQAGCLSSGFEGVSIEIVTPRGNLVDFCESHGLFVVFGESHGFFVDFPLAATAAALEPFSFTPRAPSLINSRHS